MLSSPARYPPIVLLTSWIGLVLGVIIFTSSTFSVLFGPISSEFGWSRTQLSLAYSLFSLTSTLALPAIGRLVDRIGARQVVVGCTLVFVATMLLLRFVTSLWQFYALFVVAGVISGGTSTLPYFKVLIRVFAARRGLALGIANSGTAAGTLLFPLVAYRLNAAVGWRDTYALMGVGIAVVVIPVVMFGLREGRAWTDWRDAAATGDAGVSREGGTPSSSPSPNGRAAATVNASLISSAENSSSRDLTPPSLTLKEAMLTARFWLVGVAFFIATTALVGYLIHLVPLLKDRGVPAATAALAASIFGGAQLFGRLGAGFLLDKLATPFVAAGLWLLASLAFFILWSGIAGYPLLVCTALAGLAFGGEGDVLAYLVGRLFGSDSFGRIYSVLLMINLLGAVVGPYLFGAAFDATGNYTIVLAGTAGATLLAAALILSLRRYEPEFSRRLVE